MASRSLVATAAHCAVFVTAAASFAAAPHELPFPNSAHAPCAVEGTSLRFHLDAAPPEGTLTFPRLNNVVLGVFWTSHQATDSEPHAAPPLTEHRYVAPPLPSEPQLLSLTQTPQEWTIRLPDTLRYPATIHLQCDSPPQFSPDGHICTASEDGTITLPARHGIVTGEKLQFEPLPHKNTIGYWVNADDFVEWSFATPTADTWEVHVLQGCGGGQGGSQIRVTVDTESLDHTVVETGHFQNFRWRHLGSLALPASEHHRLQVACIEKQKNAVMDIRQIRLVPSRVKSLEPLSVGQRDPDVLLPPLSSLPPAAGRRVVVHLPHPEANACYHTLSLPTDWQPGRRYPVLAEWAGNGPYRDANGDTNSGRVEDATLAQGLAGTDGMIVLGLPFLDDAGHHNVTQWWGTPPTYDHTPSVAYAKLALRDVCERFGGDPEQVILVGFSRGSIACNALGLADDEISSLWKGAICFSHYDGLRTWPFPQSAADAARDRLGRLHGRSQLILAESIANKPADAPHPALVATRRFLDEAGANGAFTFIETGFVNHDDDWALRPSPARQETRRWLSDRLSLPDRNESL
jgi:hypothetical protein